MILSFTKQAHDVFPKFRQRISAAESDADMNKFFRYTIKELLSKVLAEDIQLDMIDTELTPGQRPFFTLGGQILGNSRFIDLRDNSDLTTIMSRMAACASHRVIHLRGNNLKTKAKIKRH